MYNKRQGNKIKNHIITRISLRGNRRVLFYPGKITLPDNSE